MKDGFYHVNLDKSSSPLHTFNAPFVRYSMNRLPFGISCAPKVFQKWNGQIFGEISGVFVVFGDTIIAGTDDDHHDDTLCKVLRQARAKGVKFNKNKTQYKVSEVRYLGHTLSAHSVRPDDSKVRAIFNMSVPSNEVDLLCFFRNDHLFI